MRIFLLCAVALLVACGGGDDQADELLHLEGFDITPDNYRTTIRELFLESDAQSFCNGIQGLSPSEVVDTLDPPDEESVTASDVPSRATPLLDQAGDADDKEAAAAIIIAECARIR